MKFFKSFALAFLLCFTCIGMASCTQTETPPLADSKDTTPSIPEQPKETMDVNVLYTSTTLETGTVEDTVAAIYDSVVAIDAYLNGTLYGSGSGVLFG